MSYRIEAIIDALRKKLLDAAVRGELVDQNNGEEPASALLERIAAERSRLIREKKIKKPKSSSRIERRDGHFYESVDGSTPVCIDDELPFEIPDSWKWVRLGEISESALGKTLDQKKNKGELQPYLCSINVRQDGVSLSTLKKARFEQEELEKYCLAPGDLLVCEGGDVGRAAVWEQDSPMYYQNALHRIRFFGKISPHYIRDVMELYKFSKELDKFCKGVTIKHLVQTELRKIFIPIPPLQEQHRIVEALERQLKQLDILRESHRRMRRILNETPTSLRQQLLQAAIEGKLVAQDPKEEPASALLERIAKERASLPGKRKAAPQSRIERRPGGIFELFPDGSEKDISDEIPFDIPESWEWSRFGDICINRDSERVPLSMPQRSKQAKIFDYYGASGVIDKVEKFIFEGRFLLIGEDGANLINRSTDIAFFAEGQFWVNNHAHVLSAYREMPLDFICSYINGISLTSFVSGTAQPKLTQAKLNSILVPIPPAREQHRIMQQLKKVLSLVNQS